MASRDLPTHTNVCPPSYLSWNPSQISPSKSKEHLHDVFSCKLTWIHAVSFDLTSHDNYVRLPKQRTRQWPEEIYQLDVLNMSSHLNVVLSVNYFLGNTKKRNEKSDKLAGRCVKITVARESSLKTFAKVLGTCHPEGFLDWKTGTPSIPIAQACRTALYENL